MRCVGEESSDLRHVKLQSAPPEVAQALHSGNRDILPQPSQDAWGLGLVAFELLAGSPSYDLEKATYSEVCIPRKRAPFQGCWSMLGSYPYKPLLVIEKLSARKFYQ